MSKNSLKNVHSGMKVLAKIAEDTRRNPTTAVKRTERKIKRLDCTGKPRIKNGRPSGRGENAAVMQAQRDEVIVMFWNWIKNGSSVREAIAKTGYSGASIYKWERELNQRIEEWNAKKAKK